MSAAMTVDDSIPALLVILDGLGDLPCAVLGGETPAEYADTPVLDELTSRGCHRNACSLRSWAGDLERAFPLGHVRVV